MSRLLVRPGDPLSGEVVISGAKNSVLKLMAATVLAEGRYVLRNVPDISDVTIMGRLLEAMGMSVRRREDAALEIVRGPDVVAEAPYELVEQMRASTAVLGPLLAGVGRARVALPGGDDFGSRPVDMHLASLEALGASFALSHGMIEGHAEKLIGAEVVLEYPSVGATENLLMAGATARGTTTVRNAAREPEISDLAAFLNRMGARVLGAGSPTIVIEGVDELRAVEHTVIPDRVEVVTFLAAVAVAGGEVTLRGARADHVDLLIEKMGRMGLRISPEADGLWAMSSGRPRPIDVATLPYPGIATDYLPMLVAVMCLADGTSYATENVFAGRFRYVGELARMGADIRVEGHHLVIDGVERLSGAPVRAVDIRAGAAMAIAALAADGETTIHDAGPIDRGYESFVEKLSGLGADITRQD
ncbi:MAG TPA: UDP-N-acetylglucosamine 1-carboxyvinyltransferase [Microthrixaceae bacterium]|nr:UDP-N-acetylglucosamine 1-carboxyvinyltransferase [Microthrixaceae bacterium]MCB9375214.1 UDP-N-acetylglucosamine 1-carboxyvinyltransferase [Microthrixaceae bacterium]MCB9401426.1 UDP-N-acetylglucosamine 1-carboxyvinyltransferase [Microthrixaceae bacterium]MCO5305341.1 UDP-N-acetylglucosamine 1-carboxyvinyltransferase [Microthrixaceae bacterium]HPG13240.1 UDP-N-acetylglucosamine 1-carboxyvinyltransferase [Microthrixaceae bacterium]